MLAMYRSGLSACALVGLAWGLAALAVTPARGFASAAFVGAERCKLCHRAVYESWLATPHASSAALPSNAARRCVRCHETAPGGPDRIECEACHGAGGDYWPAEVMIDPDKAAMAGLVRPDEAVCRRCHVNDEPGHRDFEMPSPAEWPRAVHVVREP